MKIKTRVIAELDPCLDRFENWKKYYGKETYSISNFLRLKKITREDKLWVALRLAPRIVVETFAIDCAVAAHAAAARAAVYTAARADAAAARAADAAARAAAYATRATANRSMEYLRQLDALEYLINAYENEMVD